MDPEKVKAALEALKSNDTAAAMALLEEWIVSLASGEAMPAGESPSDPPPSADAAAAAADAQMAAFGRTACALLGRENPGEALSSLRDLHAASLRAAEDARNLEVAERAGLVADLVKLGAEVPATAFADPLAEKPAICARLASEPIASLRARVAALKAAAGTAVRAPVAAPSARTYTKAEQAFMANNKMTPEQFEAHKATLARRSA